MVNSADRVKEGGDQYDTNYTILTCQLHIL